MSDANDKTPDAAPATLRSSTDLANWGLPLVAYVRHAGQDGAGGWVIAAADGTPIGVAPKRELAFAAARQNDLEPVSVH